MEQTEKGLKGFFGMLSRRGFFRGGGLAALAGLFGAGSAQAKKGRITTYESMGVRPVVNGWGTMTILSGSLMLPEVVTAIEEGAKHYVHMDELMEGAGKKIAELTGAEWGIVTSGAAGAICGATCACMVGGDPEKMAMLPNTDGMKNEVLINTRHRNDYDRAIWITGAKTVEYTDRASMEKLVSPRTAMVYVLGEGLTSAMPFEDIIAVAKKNGIPVLVDGAAEEPNVPISYLQKGADLVTYSGGKCIRGPQNAGLLIGRKDLCQAAFLNLAPHHAFGRPMKVGKELVVGMVTALDMWVNVRDHKAEQAEFTRKLTYIAKAATKTPGVTATVNPARGISNYAPTLSIAWDATKVKITPSDAYMALREGKPRIWIPSSGRGLSIMSYMLEKGDEVTIGKRIGEVLSAAAKA
jgi:uncharacterized pyridoxal phosphate-dependent enzyme